MCQHSIWFYSQIAIAKIIYDLVGNNLENYHLVLLLMRLLKAPVFNDDGIRAETYENIVLLGT